MSALKLSLIVVVGLAALGGGAVLVRDAGGTRLGDLTRVEQTSAQPEQGPVEDISTAVAETPPDVVVAVPPAPAIDIVRFQQDGAALVSGSGTPGTTVEIVVDGSSVWSGRTDPRGEFVAFVDLPASTTARTLWLRSDDGEGNRQSSDGSVVLAPSPEAIANAHATSGRGPDLPACAEAEPGSMPAQVDLQAPTLQNDPEGVRPLAPEPVDPENGLALDSVRYGADGEVILAGRSDAAGGNLSIYLDGQIAGRARTTSQGDWQAILADVPSGLYRLRADLTDREGRVASRVDLPFRREAPAVVEAARITARESDQAAALLTVQPGYSLWIIARDRYGDGLQYVTVYEANAETIADPDLIYPGQVLTLPAGPYAPAD